MIDPFLARAGVCGAQTSGIGRPGRCAQIDLAPFHLENHFFRSLFTRGDTVITLEDVAYAGDGVVISLGGQRSTSGGEIYAIWCPSFFHAAALVVDLCDFKRHFGPG